MPNYKCEQFRQDTFDFNGRCALTLCGMLKDEKQWQECRHKHDDACELILVLRGEGNVCIKNEIIPFKAGDLIVHNAGVVHTEQLLSINEPIYILYSVLSDISIRALPDNSIVPKGMSPVIPTGCVFKTLKNTMETLYLECKHQDPGYESVVQGLAQALLTLTTRLANDHYQLMLNGTTYSLDKQIRQFIEANYKRNLTLKKIAAHFYISHYYLEHIFKQANNLSPISYLIKFRMNKACAILETTDISIKSIASTLGYDNPAYFSHAFKKYSGVSPCIYRKLHKRHGVKTAL